MPEEFKEIKLKGEATPMIDYSLVKDPMTKENEVLIRFGRPHQESGWFTEEDIDNLIKGLEKAKEELGEVV